MNTNSIIIEQDSISTHATRALAIRNIKTVGSVKLAVPQIRPWVRYFARITDIWLFSVVVGFTVAILAPSVLNLPEIVLTIGILFAWVFQESILMTNCGTTPGKWLFKIKVRDSRGKKLSFSDALNRSFSVLFKGFGAGIPIISLFTLLSSRSKLKRDGITIWDEEGGYVVTHEKIGALRSVVITMLFLGFFSLIAWEGALEEQEYLGSASNSLGYEKLLRTEESYVPSVKNTVEGKYGSYSIDYEPSIWRLEKETQDTDAEFGFSHVDGDVYAVVVYERISIPLDVLERLVIANLESIASDVRVLSRRILPLGDKVILSVKYECTIMTVPFVYQAYLSSSEEGTLQFFTYTSKYLFQEYEHDCHALLSGLNLGS